MNNLYKITREYTDLYEVCFPKGFPEGNRKELLSILTFWYSGDLKDVKAYKHDLKNNDEGVIAQIEELGYSEEESESIFELCLKIRFIFDDFIDYSNTVVYSRLNDKIWRDSNG